MNSKERHADKEAWLNQHPTVRAWLKDRPENTQRQFSDKLMTFCQTMSVDPEAWRHLDKFAARDLAWRYIEPFKGKESARASLSMVALKNWYRNFNGEVLPLDSGRGGKHQLKLIRKKAAIEHIPSKEEMYRIIDMASNLRDKAILFFLFCAGVRENVIGHITYGLVKDQLNQDIIRLTITWDLDVKLKSLNVPFYKTRLNGEAVIVLRQFCEMYHKKSKDDTPLFYTKKFGNAVDQQWVWKMVKNCVRKVGLDPRSIWTHTIRKAFRKVVRQAPDLDDDDREQLMGHTIKGSRDSYYDRNDEALIDAAYRKCNFTRVVPASEVTKLRAQIEELDKQHEQDVQDVSGLIKRVELLEEIIKKAVKPS